MKPVHQEPVHQEVGDVVFIDANVYLEFYGSSDPKRAKLLPALQTIASSLFVTTQIRDEVVRNRAKVTSDLLDTLTDKIDLAKIQLPEHLGSGSAIAVRSWNKDYVAACGDKKNGLPSRLEAIRDQLVEEVVSGTDSVSVGLDTIFKSAKPHSEEELKRARDRQERGNPPGKSRDPLGDQLSWEQLLESYHGDNRIWIVSKDFDFVVPLLSNVVKLNPFLFDELKRKAKNRSSAVDVRCFQDLRGALEDFKKSHGSVPITVPPAEEILPVGSTVQQYHLYSTPSGIPPAGMPGMAGSVPSLCPGCGGALLGQAGVSPHGRMSWNFRCSKCGRGFIQL